MSIAHAFLGWLASLGGDAAEAGGQFSAADQIEVADDPDGDHLYSLRGTLWAEWLARTGRPGPARTLTDRNAEISRRNGWNEDVARCDRLLGRLALAAGDTAAAGKHLAAAAGCFRDGDYLIELADTLADLAEYARAAGDLAAAGRHADEAITITAPRALVPAQSAALATRARIRAAQATARQPRSPRPGPGRSRRRTAPRYPPSPGLARARSPAGPRRPRPGRGHRPRLGRPSRRPARTARPVRPGSRSAGYRRAARRRPEGCGARNRRHRPGRKS